MPEQHSTYLARARALLTKDRGWIKPVLVLAAAAFVPVVGPLGLLGYALEWARLTAWGVDAAPKQGGVRVGECIRSGWRGFVAGIGYYAAAMVVNALLTNLFGDNFITDVLGIALNIAASVAFMAGALRAAIYQSYLAGYQFRRLWDMVRRDADGLIKVALVHLLLGVLLAVVLSVLSMVVIIPIVLRMGLSMGMGTLIDVEYLDESSVRYIFFQFLDALAASAPWLALLAYAGSMGSVLVSLLSHTAMGLWFRQFDVPAWGASDDPLPGTGGLPPAGYAPTDGTAYGAGQPYDAPQGYAQQYDQQYTQQYGQQYDQQYGQLYTQQYAQQYDQQYGQQYAQPAQPQQWAQPAPADAAAQQWQQPYEQPVEPQQWAQPVPTNVATLPAVTTAPEQPAAVPEQPAMAPVTVAPIDIPAEPVVAPAPTAEPATTADVVAAPDLAPEPETAEVAEPRELGEGLRIVEVTPLTVAETETASAPAPDSESTTVPDPALDPDRPVTDLGEDL